jgi:N-acetylneuraminic acid mutarotase
MKIYSLIIFLLASGISKAQYWSAVQAFPGTERDDGISFIIKNKAYCGTGLKTGWIPTSDMYSYDMISDAWDDISDLPNGSERQYAVGFSNDTLQ